MIAWTPKEHRIIDCHVRSLFSPKAFIAKPTKEYFNDIRNLAGMINIDGKQHFLSPTTRDQYTTLTDIFFRKNEISSFFTRSEVYQQIVQSHKEILCIPDKRDSDTYINHALSSLDKKKAHYKFLIPIDGIKLTDIHHITIGNILLCESDKSVLSEIQLEKCENIDSIYDQFKSKYWVIGEAYGGPEAAWHFFVRSTKIAVGILAIYGAALFKHTFQHTKINAKLTAFSNRDSALSLRWVKGGGKLSTSIKWGKHQDFKLSKKLMSELSSDLFFDNIADLTTSKSNSELHCALRTAILWFYDAYQDQHLTMKFIKLWSCSECFFTVHPGTITNDNATGIAAILAFAGYSVIDPDEYKATKSKIKKLYDIRSKSLHNAELGVVTHKDLDTLAHWIAWLIISLVALSEQGYKTLKQVEDQIVRLDAIQSAT